MLCSGRAVALEEPEILDGKRLIDPIDDRLVDASESKAGATATLAAGSGRKPFEQAGRHWDCPNESRAPAAAVIEAGTSIARGRYHHERVELAPPDPIRQIEA